MAKHKSRQQFLLVEARNSQVKEGLQKTYAAKVPGGVLEVFCVSNRTYEKYTRKGDLHMVNASGIPALRSFCYSITAQKQLLEAKHFLTSRLGTLLNSLQIWVDRIQENPRRNLVESKQSLDISLAEFESKVLADFSAIRNEAERIKVVDAFIDAQSDFTHALAEQVLQFTGM